VPCCAHHQHQGLSRLIGTTEFEVHFTWESQLHEIWPGFVQQNTKRASISTKILKSVYQRQWKYLKIAEYPRNGAYYGGKVVPGWLMTPRWRELVLLSRQGENGISERGEKAEVTWIVEWRSLILLQTFIQCKE